jgi:hypothetical protein
MVRVGLIPVSSITIDCHTADDVVQQYTFRLDSLSFRLVKESTQRKKKEKE